MCVFQAVGFLQDYRTATRQGHKKPGGSGDGQTQNAAPALAVARAPPGHSMQEPLPASALAVPVSEHHKSKQRPRTHSLHRYQRVCREFDNMFAVQT